MQVKEQWSWFKYSQLNDLNWNLRVSWWKWSILLMTRTQQHQPSLAEQQLCPRLLFLCSAITPALVSDKPAPVSLAVQSVALMQRQTSTKREHYSAVTATSSSAFPILLRRQRICAREMGTCIVRGRSTAVFKGFLPKQSTKTLCTFPTEGQSQTLGDSRYVLM